MELQVALRHLSFCAGSTAFDADFLLGSLARDDTVSLVRALADAMTTGQLSPELWRAATSLSIPRDPAVALGRLWDDLVEAGVATTLVGMPSTWEHGTLRLWAYTTEWTFFEQDEDLFLMDEPAIDPLLKIAAERRCPKREYLLSIVEHWARDSAFKHAGTPNFREFVAGLPRYSALALKADAPRLASYLERLHSYGVPATVHRDDAHARAVDLTRCHEPDGAAVHIERDGKYWRVTLPSNPPKTLRIAQTDGSMR